MDLIQSYSEMVSMKTYVAMYYKMVDGRYMFGAVTKYREQFYNTCDLNQYASIKKPSYFRRKLRKLSIDYVKQNETIYIVNSYDDIRKILDLLVPLFEDAIRIGDVNPIQLKDLLVLKSYRTLKGVNRKAFEGFNPYNYIYNGNLLDIDLYKTLILGE